MKHKFVRPWNEKDGPLMPDKDTCEAAEDVARILRDGWSIEPARALISVHGEGVTLVYEDRRDCRTLSIEIEHPEIVGLVNDDGNKKILLNVDVENLDFGPLVHVFLHGMCKHCGAPAVDMCASCQGAICGGSGCSAAGHKDICTVCLGVMIDEIATAQSHLEKLQGELGRLKYG